jgi:hypothetical protein
MVSLVGGRIDIVERETVPTLVYRLFREHSSASQPLPAQIPRPKAHHQGLTCHWTADDSLLGSVGLGARDLENLHNCSRTAAAEP